MTRKTPDVDAAYALQTPEDSKRLYAEWAATYDKTFAEKTGFLMPSHVAELFHEHGGRGPVLDAGAGTGLVAERILAAGGCEIDAFDISREMLQTAREKAVYRQLFEGDLTGRLPFADGSYNAVVSSGTFTHGHVGPEALDELLRIAAPDALFVLTIKKDHYETRGFAQKFEALSPMIRSFETETRPVYGEGAPDGHARDQGLIVIFRRG